MQSKNAGLYRSHPSTSSFQDSAQDAYQLNKEHKEHGIPHAFDNYRDLLALKDVDVVTIATPNDLHAQITIDAARDWVALSDRAQEWTQSLHIPAQKKF